MGILSKVKRKLAGLSDLPKNIKDFSENTQEFGKLAAKRIFIRRLVPPGKTPVYIKTIYSYMENEFHDIAEQYNRAALFSTPDYSEKIPVWVCWWQGEENAPEIVKLCLKNLRLRLPSYAEVILITKDNYTDYLSIPEYITDKHNAGIISTAHFSDVLRFCLLSSFGGMWIDATVFATGAITDEYLKTPFFSPKVSDENKPSGEASEGKWCGFLMSGCAENPLFCYTRDCLLKYWKEHNAAIDYVFFDYIIMSGYKNVPCIREQIDSVKVSNEHIWDLLRLMNEPYDIQVFKTLTEKNVFHKLTYKRSFVNKCNGKSTFYHALISMTE